MKKIYISYLFLLPFFYLLHNYNQLFGFIPVKEIFGFFFRVCILGGLSYLIAWLFTKSLSQSALITFFILAFTLFFRSYHDFIKGIAFPAVWSSYKFVILFPLLLCGYLVYYLIKHPDSLKKISGYLTILFLVLCTVEVFTTLINYKRFIKDHNLIYPEKPVCNEYKSCNQPDSLKPDIYFLVFDEYTNNKTLQSIWRFDNSAITNWLSGKGFYIVDNSRANYDFTPFSISSTFNMNYLDKEKGTKGDVPFYILQSVQSISNNETLCLLKKENYSFRFITPFVSRIETIDQIREFDDFPKGQLYNQTLPARLSKDIFWKWPALNRFVIKYVLANNGAPSYADVKKRKEGIFTTIEKIKTTADPSISRKPKFIYGHFMITHEPHLFDSTGFIDTNTTKTTENQLFYTYTQQILYANKVIKKLVEHIQMKNKKNTIIIIEGDHGFRKLPASLKANNFANFSAIYFPSGDYSKLYKEMSPVNTYRIIFNQYFCQKLPLLNDSSTFVKY